MRFADRVRTSGARFYVAILQLKKEQDKLEPDLAAAGITQVESIVVCCRGTFRGFVSLLLLKSKWCVHPLNQAN